MIIPSPAPTAVILAGGLGTRLRTVVSDRPKCMAPVNGKPFLERLVRKVAGHGVTDFVLCVGYLREAIQAHFGDGSGVGLTIRYAVEEDLLGTGGAVGNARPFVPGEFLLLNGDTYLDLDYGALWRFHRSHAGDGRYVGSIASVGAPGRAAYGSIATDPEGRVVAFAEKAGDKSGAGWINGGVYCLRPGIFRFIPPGRPSSLEGEVIPSAIAGGFVFFAYPAEGAFVDIGTPAGYDRVRELLAP